MKTKTTINGFARLSSATTEWLNGTVTLNVPGSWVSESWPDYVTHGENFANWRQQIINGFDATTYLEGERKSKTSSPGFAYRKRVNKWNPNIEEFRAYGPMNTAVLPFPSSPHTIPTEEAARQALTKFNNRTREVNQSFNGGVFLGELGQTLRGIARPARALDDGIRSYRRAAVSLRNNRLRSVEHLNSMSASQRRQAVGSVNKAIAGLWLEGQFHWRPLLNDIDDGVKTLAELSSSRERWKIVSSTARTNESTVTTSPVEGYANYATYQTTVATVKEASVRMKGAIGIEPKRSGLPTLRNLGLDLSNFVPTLWELVPYSFVADYFTNIGDVISGFSSGGLNVRWCCYTVRQNCKATRTMQSAGKPDDDFFWRWVISEFRGPVEVSEWTKVSRESYRGSYRPSFTWEIPGMSTKWINLGALTTARLTDRFT